MNKLILIEGIPGTGKTTLAQKLYDYYKEANIEVKKFNEGELHPADLAWHADLSLQEYDKLLIDYPNLKKKFETNTLIEDHHAIIAYSQLNLSSEYNHLKKYLESKEVYNNYVSLDTFKKRHIERWTRFNQMAKDDPYIYIFDCAYLQNHVTELMGIYDLDFDDIKKYMLELINVVADLNPILFYLDEGDVKETILRVAKERVAPPKTNMKNWIDVICDYIEHTKYAKKHHLKGIEGTINFFENRKSIEKAIMMGLNIDKSVIPNDDLNWDVVSDKVISLLIDNH